MGWDVNFFDDRAASTRDLLGKFAQLLRGHLGDDAERILRTDTCVYVVGSGGRGEMSCHSDVDLFVARLNDRA